MNRLRQLQDFGQSIWFDNIHRAMLHNGELAAMIRDDGLRGITSNPTIFEKAITGSTDYDGAIAEILNAQPGITNRELFFNLAIQDIQGAADMLLPVYRETNGQDGYVSLEVGPDLAYDTKGTIEEAQRLWKRVNRPNLMIKVPATKAGLPVIEKLINDGINVNVTLLFSVQRYREVVDAYISGLEARLRRGQALNHVASVASFFVSRVDSAVDKILSGMSSSRSAELARSLMGKMAIANAKLAYASFNEIFASKRFVALKEHGAQVQRLLWASTGTKSAEYSDVLYLDELIGPHTVNTVPPATYKAFKDHGNAKSTLAGGLDMAQKQFAQVTGLGVDMDKVTDALEKEGVDAFAKSFTNLLAAIDAKTSTLSSKKRARG